MQFNFFDVQYTTEERPRFPGSNISEGRFNTRRYPIDLGSLDKGHYVFFTIYQQMRSSQTTRTPLASMQPGQIGNQTATTRREARVGGTGTILGDAQGIGIDAINGILGGYGNVLKKYPQVGAALSGVNAAVETTFDAFKSSTQIETVTGENLFNQVSLIKDAVALYMPDTLAFSSRQSYSEISMSDLGLGLVGVSALNDLKKGGLTKENIAKTIGGNISPFLYAGLKKTLGSAGTNLFTAFTGQVMNPQLELLYTSPSFREFNFDFAFYPRSPKEAKDVFDIIELFRFHSAPEVKTGEAGFFLFPPSLFDIEFRYGNSENVNLPKLSSCVLTSVDVDYAPNGFAAYETGVPPSIKDSAELGGTGPPVATRMTLHFKETIVQSKNTIEYQNEGKSFRTRTGNSVQVNENETLGGASNETSNYGSPNRQTNPSSVELGAVPLDNPQLRAIDATEQRGR